jgi:hypothetical protein
MRAAAGVETRVDAWPGSASEDFARQADCTGPSGRHAFPSGRAAIVACLERLGLTPETVVATPECVTPCVAVAVRQVAQPMPLRAALSGMPARHAQRFSRGLLDRPGLPGRQGQPGAAIIYEQWGWPLPADARDAIDDWLADVPIVVDRVDSADFFHAPADFGTFEVLSLSKVLGTAAGGIARAVRETRYLPFDPAPAPARPIDASRQLSHPAVRELFKRSQRVHPSVTTWLAANCAVRAAEAERQLRSANARTILESVLAANWPSWMARAIRAGAGPVWAPILRGRAPAIHWRTVAELESRWGIAAAVRMFNWSGNPLAPRFEPAVALPIHGGVDGAGLELEEVAASLVGSRV